MPQLDKVHFLSQYFWLCVFYFGFYFLVSKHFLPRMARILQFRKNKCSHGQESGADRELSLVKESGNTALENVFSLSHKFWSHNTQRMDQWYGDKVSNLNNNYLQECNKLYIKSVGDYSLSQNAVIGGMQLARPTPCYTWFFAQKLKQPISRSLEQGTLKSSASPLTGAENLEAGGRGESKPITKKGRHSRGGSKADSPSQASLSSTNPAKADTLARKGRQKRDDSKTKASKS